MHVDQVNWVLLIMILQNLNDSLNMCAYSWSISTDGSLAVDTPVLHRGQHMHLSLSILRNWFQDLYTLSS